ncbi:MAG TPA: nucleotidyltransferase family protein [Thermoleophilaceae bacterium]
MVRTLRAQEELMLLVAGTRERRAQTAGRVRELCEQMPWDALLADLAHQGLVPLLGGRLLEVPGLRAPADFIRAVRDHTEASRKSGALMELATLRVATALEASGVPNVPLKGPLLARALHGDPGMRQSRDVDVLVERGNLELAAGALGPLGWRPEDGPAADPILHVRLVHDDALPDIELHWRVHWYETEFGARALARAQPGPTGVRRLRPVDDLAALMLYHARDGFAGLRHPSDIAAWWDAQDRGSGPLLDPIVRAYPSLTRALVAGATLLEGLVGVSAAGLVEPPARLPWGPRAAVALANPLMRGAPAQITAEVSLVDGLLAPRGQRVAFLRRRAMPSGPQLPASAVGRPIAVARVEHSLRLLRRYALALVRSRPRLPARPQNEGEN